MSVRTGHADRAATAAVRAVLIAWYVEHPGHYANPGQVAAAYGHPPQLGRLAAAKMTADGQLARFGHCHGLPGATARYRWPKLPEVVLHVPAGTPVRVVYE